MDKALIDYLVASFKNESGVNITGDKMAMNRVREARKSQDELSTTMETDINLPFMTADANGPKHFQMKITCNKMEELIKPLVDKCAIRWSKPLPTPSCLRKISTKLF